MSPSGWIEFWDAKHPIYVNARHEAAHYWRIAQDIREYGPPDAVMLDYGCGEALSADKVAESLSRLILCEAAEQDGQGIKVLRAQILRHRMQEDDVAPAVRQEGEVLGLAHHDLVVAGKARGKLTAHVWRRFAQDEPRQ